MFSSISGSRFNGDGQCLHDGGLLLREENFPLEENVENGCCSPQVAVVSLKLDPGPRWNSIGRPEDNNSIFLASKNDANTWSEMMGDGKDRAGFVSELWWNIAKHSETFTASSQSRSMHIITFIKPQ